jgi:uncharacterized protein YjiS (DUF1127 family)
MRTAPSPSTIHHWPSRPVWQRLHALLARALDVLRIWQDRCRSRRTLRQLDDWLLQDVGLSRAVAAREARKPFWRP